MPQTENARAGVPQTTANSAVRLLTSDVVNLARDGPGVHGKDALPLLRELAYAVGHLGGWAWMLLQRAAELGRLGRNPHSAQGRRHCPSPDQDDWQTFIGLH